MGARKWHMADAPGDAKKRYRLYDEVKGQRWMAATLPDLLSLVWEYLTPHQRDELLAKFVPPRPAAFVSGAKVADEDAAAVEMAGDCGGVTDWQLDIGGEGG